jgi:hypothetical protein
MNYIRYNIETKSYRFAHLHPDNYADLTADQKVEYLEQQMLWTLDEDQEKLEQLMDEAKTKALRGE